MTSSPVDRSRLPQSVPEALTRLVRHEVGDLLQTLYSAVAILKERLPPERQFERRILSDLRNRGEACKNLLDSLHDLAAPLRPEFEEVNLLELAGNLVNGARSRHPGIEVHLEGPTVPPLQGDFRRLTQLGQILLDNACGACEQRVVCRVGQAEGGELTWSVRDDGPPVPPEDTDRLFSPLTLVPKGHLGPGLASCAPTGGTARRTD